MLLGLGSILGTGVYVSIGLAAGVTGPAVIAAVVLAGAVALCNGLSSAQLAAAHPVSGGTYEYGYRTLAPPLGFTAGWMFLCAKSASAATGALGLAGYLLTAGGVAGETPRIAVGLLAVSSLTAVVLSGLRRSNRVNLVVVSVTVSALALFILAGLPALVDAVESPGRFRPFFQPSGTGSAPGALLHATALMFVAYTGYGRIATLGEEVRRPARTIPAAIGVTLGVSVLLYLGVAVVGVAAIGSAGFAAATSGAVAPLAVIARDLDVPGLGWLVAVGAVTAMLGVVLNLILGLSRVLLAMGRRGDLPTALSRLDRTRTTPTLAVTLAGVAIAALVLIGDVRVTWSFSAFTVLIYYALTNLAALRLPARARRFPRAIPLLGLTGCVGLAFWVDPAVWRTGLALIVMGLVWHALARRILRERSGRRQ